MRVGIRMVVAALATVMLVATLPLGAVASVDPVSAENQFVDLINRERTDRGLAPLATHPDLVAAARRQAAAIRDAGRLFHNPDLGAITTGWKKLGENVGYGGAVDRLHAAFMASPGHRANILEPAYTHVGLGVVVAGSTVWVAEVFMQSTTVSVQQTVFGAPFKDVSGLPYETDVAKLVQAGITSGCSSDRYCPYGYVSREEMASFLQRALGLKAPSTDFFWDDGASSHQEAINAIAQASISTGCAPGRYCPAQGVSRGEMAAFLVRALGLPTTSRDYFWDDNGSAYEAAINALAQAGITTGCGSGRYCPSGGLTRGEMATFLVRGLEL